jgi:organic radical activating enzyme
MAPLASPYDDEFFDDLATFLPGLQYAKFLGGEPFLIPEHHRAWDLMAETGCRARLQVTTNGTVWNERVQRLLERFQVDVTVSIDGATASTYEAIRRGASFDVVAANIDRFRAACERAGTELRLCFCLMPDNAHELAAMVRWTDRLGAALSVNVVTDLGLALHDLPLADLEAVRSGWAREDEVGGLGRNEQVWRVQLEQMDAVLAERRAGIGPPARQAVPATAAGLALPSVAGAGGWSVRDADAAARSTERGALEDWCERGEVAELVLTHAGTVTEVRSGHDRLGVGAQLVGSSIDELVGAIAEADGRPPWTLGVDDGRPGRVVHSLILSASPPVRGAHGSSVRIVLLAADDGVVALIAEDRIYEDRTGVVVEAPTRR